VSSAGGHTLWCHVAYTHASSVLRRGTPARQPEGSDQVLLVTDITGSICTHTHRHHWEHMHAHMLIPSRILYMVGAKTTLDIPSRSCPRPLVVEGRTKKVYPVLFWLQPCTGFGWVLTCVCAYAPSDLGPGRTEKVYPVLLFHTILWGGSVPFLVWFACD